MLENINTVLIVDDSPINVEFLSMYMAEFNVEITKAFSAEEARKEINEKPFDLTLLDYHMPVEDGVSFIKALSANEILSNLGKIIIITADPSLNIKEAGIEDLVTGIVRKPLDIEDLNKLLE